MQNFIGISRCITKHWIYQDAEYFQAWFEMLYRARYKKEPETKLIEGQLITIQYGQFIFGRKSWCERLSISEGRMRGLLKKLIKDNMVKLVHKYNKFSIYEIVNYEKYNQQDNQREKAKKQLFEGYSNQQNNQHVTNRVPAGDQQVTTKEKRKERKEYIVEIINYLNEICGTKYRSTTKSSIKHINARLEEKFTVEDFKKVIWIKAKEWKGTDQQKYLRPDTLFGTKFESYLNQYELYKEVKQKDKEIENKKLTEEETEYLRKLGVI